MSNVHKIEETMVWIDTDGAKLVYDFRDGVLRRVGEKGNCGVLVFAHSKPHVEQEILPRFVQKMNAPVFPVEEPRKDKKINEMLAMSRSIEFPGIDSIQMPKIE